MHLIETYSHVIIHYNRTSICTWSSIKC